MKIAVDLKACLEAEVITCWRYRWPLTWYVPFWILLVLGRLCSSLWLRLLLWSRGSCSRSLAVGRCRLGRSRPWGRSLGAWLGFLLWILGRLGIRRMVLWVRLVLPGLFGILRLGLCVLGRLFWFSLFQSLEPPCFVLPYSIGSLHSYILLKTARVASWTVLVWLYCRTTKPQRFPTADSEKQSLAKSYRRWTSRVWLSSSNLKIKTRVLWKTI